jgi:ubiquinone/menaquinone biosynthesis C-methylase UbiE
MCIKKDYIDKYKLIMEASMSSEQEVRKELERQFHNSIRKINDDPHVADTRWTPELEDTIKSNPLWVNMKYYSVERRSRNMVLKWFSQNCTGKRVLDYCCGNGEDSLYVAQNGARQVIGIDISDVSIENCRKRAESLKLGNILSYEVQDAEKTSFKDSSFDIITEYGSLHHLDLAKACAEMSRIVTPSGKIICNEALGHNKIIHLYRKMTPKLRTEWEVEHIIRKEKFEIIKEYFNNIDMHFFHLMTLFGVPFRNIRGFDKILRVLEWFDGLLLKMPILKWQAWQIVFILSEPKNK